MTEPEALLTGLRGILGEDGLLVGDTSRYAIDNRAPVAVAFPRSVEEVAQVVALAAETGAALVPSGSGSRLGLGGVPRAVDVVLSLGRLKRIVEHDAANLTVTAEAGLSLKELQSAVAPYRQHLPLDPPLGDRASVGGTLAANASGPRRLLYGSPRDLVLGLRAVLADGKVIRTGGKTVKNVTGYDLTKLFVGSLGTLGVIVEATFRLWPQPEAEKMVIASFAGLQPSAALSARILDSELIPSTLELLDPAAAAHLAQAASLGRLDGLHWMLVGMEGFAEAVERQASQVARLCREAGAREVRTVDGEELARVRAALSDPPRLAAERGEVVVCKMSVPVSQVERAGRALAEAAEREEVGSAMQISAGIGLLRGFLSPGTGLDPAERLSRVVAATREGVLAAGGSLILEAAPLAVKERVDAWGPASNAIRLFRSLKKQMDPAGVFSPGRYVGGL